MAREGQSPKSEQASFWTWIDRTGKAGKAWDAFWMIVIYVALPAASAATKFIGGWGLAFCLLLIIHLASWGFVWRRWVQPSREVQPTDAPPAESPPDRSFRDYTDDVIDEIRWRWEWSIAAKRPTADRVTQLAPHCPDCGFRLADAVKFWWNMSIEERGRVSPTPNDVVDPDVSAVTVLKCPDGCYERWRPGTIRSISERVRLVIEKRAWATESKAKSGVVSEEQPKS